MAVQAPENINYVERDWADFAHVGPGTLAGRYLRRFWQPFFRSQDLTNGMAMPVKVMNDEFTLYRGDTGQVHLVGMRCVHRGTQLSSGWIEGDAIRCRYHGWLYDSDGQCIEQPGEPQPFCERAKIRSYPVQEYLGLVFGYFGDDEAPPLPRYPELEAEDIITDVSIHPRMCSYFNNLENSCDEVHVSFAHWKSLRRPYVIPDVSGQETDYGIIRYGKRPDGSVRLAHIHMPNCLQLGGYPKGPGSNWQGSIAWRVPIDDESHLIPHVTVMQFDEGRKQKLVDQLEEDWDSVDWGRQILKGKDNLDSVIPAPNAISIQDEVTQVGQGRIADRQHELLGRTDMVIVLLRRLWMRELRALSEDKPLKQWRRDEELLTLPSDG